MACAMPRHVRRSADLGFSRQALSSDWMYSASLAGETVCGSRHGTGGRTEAGWRPAPVTGRVSSPVMLLGTRRPRLQFELGVTQRTHFGKVETLEFGFCGDALADDRVDDQVDDEADRENKAHEGGDPDQLRNELSGIAIKQARNRSRDAV